jgi:hypothetical protein
LEASSSPSIPNTDSATSETHKQGMTSVATSCDDDMIMNKMVFSDEAMFHLSGQVNQSNLRIQGSENPYESFEHARDSSKVNVFAAMSREKLYRPFFFIKSTVTKVNIISP